MKKIKLNSIERNTLNTREMSSIKGGEVVYGCGCQFEGNGGSAFVDNAFANEDAHIVAPNSAVHILQDGSFVYLP